MFSLRLLILAVVFSTISQDQSTLNLGAGPEQEALEPLIRSVTLGHTGPVFLRLYGRDPGRKTLARLALVYPRLIAASRSEWIVVPGSKSGGFYRQRDTQEPGEYFEVEGFKRLNSKEVAFTAGWGQACGLYSLGKSNRGWHVSQHTDLVPCF